MITCLLISAPACIRASTISTCPHDEAIMSGVRPSTSGVSGLYNALIMTAPKSLIHLGLIYYVQL